MQVSLLALITVQNRVLAQGEIAYLSDLIINQLLALVTSVLYLPVSPREIVGGVAK